MKDAMVSGGKLRRVLRVVHKVVLKTLIFANLFSLLYWACWIDAIISWQPYVIMAVNLGFLTLVAYANGWFHTSGYYDDEEEV